MAQKWAWRRSNSSSLTSRATRGSCSVGPMGPQMPAGSLFRCLAPGGDVLQCLGQVKVLQRVVELDGKTWARQLQKVVRLQTRRVIQNLSIEGRIVPPLWRHLAQWPHVFSPFPCVGPAAAVRDYEPCGSMTALMIGSLPSMTACMNTLGVLESKGMCDQLAGIHQPLLQQPIGEGKVDGRLGKGRPQGDLVENHVVDVHLDHAPPAKVQAKEGDDPAEADDLEGVVHAFRGRADDDPVHAVWEPALDLRLDVLLADLDGHIAAKVSRPGQGGPFRGDCRPAAR